jgi:hypothetical protein
VSTVELSVHRIQFKNRTSIKMKRVRLYRAGAAGWRGRRGMDFRANLAMRALPFCQNEGLGTFLSAPGRSSRSSTRDDLWVAACWSIFHLATFLRAYLQSAI